MSESRLDAIAIGAPHHVYYLSGHRPDWKQQGGFVLFADGRSWLASANSPANNVAADEAVAYEANWYGTLRQEQPATIGTAIDALLDERLTSSRPRVGIDSSAVTAHVALAAGRRELRAIDPILWQLRRAKDPDELALMKVAIRCTEAMYARAKHVIEPGVPELRVFAELHAAAVETAGEPLAALLGNDFACGTGGGPPRKDRVAKAGEIYILDLGPCYRGYFADNCRAFSVDRKPTDAQHKAWDAIAACFPIVEGNARAGARCRDVYAAVDQHLKLERKGHAGGDGMPHHLGHGVGLQPHEYPHLNPKWDDTLIEGEIFTAEPGIYGPELAGGIRLENQYLVTRDGVQNLVNIPLELV